MYNCNFPFIRSAAKGKEKRTTKENGTRWSAIRIIKTSKFGRTTGKIIIKCRDYRKPHAAMIGGRVNNFIALFLRSVTGFCAKYREHDRSPRLSRARNREKVAGIGRETARISARLLRCSKFF